ncbi:MAG: tail fiber domain-containing protein, partial [Patescibacteria group bacterium]|nr:tail fiber domain-containing protein [Patescibacteria group bacterium]
TEGIEIANHTPGTTTNRLYNTGGDLYWNGNLVGRLATLNGLTGTSQTFAVGTSGTNFTISSSGSTHTFNIPDASGTARGLVTTGSQTFAGAKTFSNNMTVSADIYASALRKTGTGYLTINNTSDAIYMSGNGGSGRTSTIIAAPPGNWQSDWPGGWTGGLATYDITAAGIYYSVLTARSDRNLKKDINDLNYGLDEVLRLRPVTFYWKQQNGGSTSGLDIGFIAQEVEQIIPEFVAGEEGKKGIKYDKIAVLLTKAIQDQYKIIEENKSKITALELKAQTHTPSVQTHAPSSAITPNTSSDSSLPQNNDTLFRPADGLDIFHKKVEFKAPAVFKAFVEFIDTIIVYGNIEFRSKVLFDQDTAGTATILAGQTEVTIIFDKEFPIAPIVNVTPTNISDTKYAVTETTTRGFTIKIANPQSNDVSFNWIAITAKGAKNFQSSQKDIKQQGDTPVQLTPAPQSPTPSITPSPILQETFQTKTIDNNRIDNSASNLGINENNTNENNSGVYSQTLENQVPNQ